MSDKTTEAMTLALEALNSIDVGYRSSSGDALEVSFDEAKCEAAIAALREALAQQTRPAQEPVAHLWRHSETGRTRVVMPDQIITADAAWVVVGPLCLATFQRILQVAEEPTHA